MKRRSILLSAAALPLAQGVQAQAPAPPKTHLKVGDVAPDFTVPTTLEKPKNVFQLSSFKGKSGVVIGFFPAAFTGGCTKQMSNFQASLEKFKAMGFEVLGMSTDNSPSQAHWAKEVLKVEFPIGSDFKDRKVSEAYGVLMKDRGLANRANFVIDIDGKITHIEEGSVAVDITNSMNACSRSKGKSE